MTVLADRRALLLQRQFEILSGLTVQLTETVIVPGNIVHNRNDLPKNLRPGIILLDADEVRDPRTPDLRSRPDAPPSPSLMRMTPEVYVVLDDRKPHNKFIGEDLLLARAAILYALLADQTLLTICGGNGTIGYDGLVTDLARNRVMEGQEGMSITYTYPFIIGELAPAA